MGMDKVICASGTGDVAAVSAQWNVRLIGFSISEDAGSTAKVIIHDGAASANNPAVAPINCAANGFGIWGLSYPGIPCPLGIWVERVSGTTTVVLYIDRP